MKSSTKPAARVRKQQFVCTVCGEKRAPTYFATKDADMCFECAAEIAEIEASHPPEPVKAPKNPPEKTKKLRLTPPEPPQDPANRRLPPLTAAQDPVEEVIDEAPFVPTDAEVDYTSPTAQELAARTLARRRLMSFIRRFRPKYLPGWVHEDICRRLEKFVKDVEDLKEPRLLLMMPVRHGKSEIGSRHFAPWVLGQHPEWEIIAASGAQSLALSFSRYIRDLVRDPSYQAVFPNLKLDASSQSVENWNTTAGGGYLAAGIGTMITGRGAHILLIDDPVKDAEAADSSIIRDATWEWYMSTALTRLAPGGGVLGIMTWWHDDDWAGRIQQIMATGEGDKFEIVKYPAINEKGNEYLLADDTIEQIPLGLPIPEGARLTRQWKTALHPARYTLESLLKRKANYAVLGQSRWWNSLYQQNPTPEEGAYFTKKQFQPYGQDPRRMDCNIYQAWDFAITEKALSDWTVGVTLFQDQNDCLYVVDVFRFRLGDGAELMTAVVNYAMQWKPTLIGFEDGQIWKALHSTFTRTCEEKQYYPAYETLQPLTDKMVRAQPLRGRMQAGKMFFNKRAHWYPDYEAELLRFPSGKHDDQVDATAWATRLTLSKAAPRPPAPPKLPSWKDGLGKMLEGDTSHMSS